MELMKIELDIVRPGSFDNGFVYNYIFGIKDGVIFGL